MTGRSTSPEGWKQVTLSDILPDDAIAEISQLVILRQTTARDFKPVLEKHREHLLARGVVVDYLAYLLEFTFNTPGQTDEA